MLTHEIEFTRIIEDLFLTGCMRYGIINETYIFYTTVQNTWFHNGHRFFITAKGSI